MSIITFVERNIDFYTFYMAVMILAVLGIKNLF